MSQELVAKEANTDLTQMGGIERGLRNPSYESLSRIAKALNSTVGEIATLADRYRLQWEREEGEA